MRSTVRVNTNGRVVVPSHVRDELGVEHGDLVEIDVRPISKND
ncbi:AbrB/MazE/SpoVT family DNA-binding domain-containing protein [Halorutilus salinus]